MLSKKQRKRAFSKPAPLILVALQENLNYKIMSKKLIRFNWAMKKILRHKANVKGTGYQAN